VVAPRESGLRRCRGDGSQMRFSVPEQVNAMIERFIALKVLGPAG
jgi:hypothetical protein